jgi:CubicO group peptidase (beta-lactamase class C family)
MFLGGEYRVGEGPQARDGGCAMQSRQAGVALVLLLFATPLAAGERFAPLDDYVEAALKEWRVPGLAIAIVKEGKIVLARGYGITRTSP